ncbi:MAG: DNA polymerase III subunit delta [Balneolales bacterium]
MVKKKSSLEHFNSLLGELGGLNTKPVYAILSPEKFFSDRLQDAAIATVPEEARDFNLDILYGLEVNVNKVVDICRSYPMMAERRVVVVRDFMNMFEPGRFESQDTSRESHFGKSLKEETTSLEPDVTSTGQEQGGQDDLVAYLKQPNPATLLILTNEKGPSLHTRLGKALKKSETIEVQKFDPVSDDRLPQWISEWASIQHNLQFEETAVQLLGFHVGNNLQQLTSEIEKLSNYRKDREPITEKDVRQVVRFSREFTLFDFSDALLDKKRDKAMFIADQMLKTSGSAAGEVIKLVGFLYATFGRIWHIQHLSRKGLTPNQIKSAVGINSSYYYKKLVSAGQNYPLHTYPWLFEVLLDADRAVKGFSKETPEAILLMTVKKITD